MDWEAPQFSASGEYGSHSTKNAAIGTRGDTGFFDYAFSVQRFDTDGISAADDTVINYSLPNGGSLTTGGNTEDDAYENTTAHFKFGFDPTSSLRIDGVVRYTNFESDFDSFTTIPC